MRWLSFLLVAACVDRPAPLVEAHRTGAGYWPENSTYGAREAMLQNLDGIEVDLVLTRDLVPVLHHDPAVSTRHCRMADGSKVPKNLWIRDLSFEELQSTVLCGGIPLDAFPQAVVLAEPMLSFDGMLALMRDHSDARQLIHLDIKQEPGVTLPASAFAEAIVGRWVQADLPNRVHISSNLPDVLKAFRTEANLYGISLETTLIWPRFPVDGSKTKVALKREGAILTGTEDYVALAEETQVDHLALNWELVDRHLAAVAQREGVGIMLWTPNDPALLHRLAKRWPVDVLITDFPGDAP